MRLTFILAAGITMAFATSSFAQERTVNGTVVSAEQMGAVQSRCDEIRALQTSSSVSLSLEASSSELSAAEMSAPGATDEPVAESPAETPVEPAESSGPSSSSAASVPVDLEALTFEVCETGGFYAAM